MKSSSAQSRQKILFTSIVGPYGVDTERSRYKNPMALLANQVTRGQQYYTVQMSCRTFAFDLFGVNLNADVAVLNFPMPDTLTQVLRSQDWDRIGISAIVPNFEALLETYRLIRAVLPTVAIDIGGHIANDERVLREWTERALALQGGTPPGRTDTFNVWKPSFETSRIIDEPFSLNSWLEARGCLGPGVTFVKRNGLDYYAELAGVGLKDPNAVSAPLVNASTLKRVMGIPLPGNAAGLLIPDIGCPMKCNFCATSHKFGGRFVQFLRSAEDIMAVANAHADQGKTEMFVMSENFSLNTNRALRLLRLMEEQRRPHRYSVFSSANGLIKLGVENIVKLGYSFIWIGLEESSGTTYEKTHQINLKSLVQDLQAHGVEILGSTILGFAHQDLGDLDREVAHALDFQCVYNQFMLYMPTPGTGFYDEIHKSGKLREGYSWTDLHGQHQQNWIHPRIAPEDLEARLDRAFEQDFEVLGPSLFRMMQVHYDGWLKTQSWSHELVQMRRANMQDTFLGYIPLLSAMAADLGRLGHTITPKVRILRDRLVEATGWKGRAARALGPVASAALAIEKFRYARSVAQRKAESPRCTLTHYGTFPAVSLRGIPRPEAAYPSIRIPRLKVMESRNDSKPTLHDSEPENERITSSR